MSLSQSRRAINERRRRVVQREKRRRSVFVHDYIRTKYFEIYNECNAFDQNLSEKYPEKLDLTKSKEYKKWKGKLSDGTQSESDTTGKISDGSQCEADTAGETLDQNSREAGIAVENISCETLDQNSREADIAIENISGESTVTTGNFEEPAAEPSILQIAAQELLPASPISIENMDRIIHPQDQKVPFSFVDVTAGLPCKHNIFANDKKFLPPVFFI